MNERDKELAVKCRLLAKHTGGIYTDSLQEFADLIRADEREKVAAWVMQRGYATGHGDTIEDLLQEIDWQVAERERKACLNCYSPDDTATDWADKIRARGNT